MVGRKLGFGLVAVVVVLMALFIWPTRYRYEKVKFGSSEMLVRFDRLGWDAWMLTASGWRQISGAAKMPPLPPGFVLDKGPDARAYTDDELRRIAGLDEHGKPVKK